MRIKRYLAMNDDLNVEWRPDSNGTLEGEVKGRTIYTYSENEKDALQTLRHEVVDYIVSQTIEPYWQLTNAFINLLNIFAATRCSPACLLL